MRNVNAPDPSTGERPDRGFININQFESSASSRSHGVILMYRGELNRAAQLHLRDTLSETLTDTAGPFVPPANNFDLTGEWGRADFDRRHRVHLAGIFRLPLGISLGAIGQIVSNRPFNITTGSDDNRVM